MPVRLELIASTWSYVLFRVMSPNLTEREVIVWMPFKGTRVDVEKVPDILGLIPHPPNHGFCFTFWCWYCRQGWCWTMFWNNTSNDNQQACYELTWVDVYNISYIDAILPILVAKSKCIYNYIPGNPFVLCFASKRRSFPINTRDIWVPGWMYNIIHLTICSLVATPFEDLPAFLSGKVEADSHDSPERWGWSSTGRVMMRCSLRKNP